MCFGITAGIYLVGVLMMTTLIHIVPRELPPSAPKPGVAKVRQEEEEEDGIALVAVRQSPSDDDDDDDCGSSIGSRDSSLST